MKCANQLNTTTTSLLYNAFVMAYIAMERSGEYQGMERAYTTHATDHGESKSILRELIQTL
jgi:hypothetical protein